MRYDPQISLGDRDTMPHTREIEMIGRDKNVLDIGCGRGNTGRILVSQFGCTLRGIEFDPRAAEVARSIYDQVVVGDVEDVSLLEQVEGAPFDVILLGDVLEHLRQPERVLAAVKRLLKPDGFVIVSLPNVVTMRLRLRFLLGRFDYTDQGIMDRTHLRFFTLQTATALAHECGYRVAEFDFMVGPNVSRRLRRFGIPKRWLPPSLLGTQFIFKLRPVVPVSILCSNPPLAPSERGASAPSEPRVHVVVLNYNSQSHLAYCLPSIEATDYPNLEIVVVDNASTDDSVAFVAERFPGVTLLRSPANRGWCSGNNLGIQRALADGADYIVLANPDIRVAPRWIRVAVSVAETDSRIGIIGFRILEPRGGDEDAGFGEAVANWAGLEVRENGVVDGMAFFIRSDLVRQLGLLDEGFFLFAGENDLVRRASRAGYRIVVTNVPIWHRGQATTGRLNMGGAYDQIRSNLRLSLKHDSPRGILRALAYHYAKACLPFVRVDPTDPVAARLRPSNVFFNFCLVTRAIAWNVWRLPATLQQRRGDAPRIQTARRALRRQ